MPTTVRHNTKHQKQKLQNHVAFLYLRREQTNLCGHRLQICANGKFINPNLKIEDLLNNENKLKYDEKWYKISLEKHIKSLERWKEIEY